MRIWGITFILIAAGCVVLPDPLGRFLLVVAVAAGTVALVVEYVDKADRVRQAPVVAKDRAYIADLQALTEQDDQLDDEWREWLGNTTTEGRPLTEPRPPRLRKVIPAQRKAGDLS